MSHASPLPLDRDHTRPHTASAPSIPAVEARLTERLRLTQQALSLRLRCLPAGLFADLFATVLPTLQARTRPPPPVDARTLTRFERVWIADATTLPFCAKTAFTELDLVLVQCAGDE